MSEEVSGQKPSILSVAVSYGDVRAEFSGTPEAVLASVNQFIAKQIPSLDIASRISVSYSTQELISMFADFVRLTPEGPRVWVEGQRLSDKGLISLQLVATKIGHGTGRLPKPSATLPEIQAATGLNPKSISSRLSEMSKAGYAERESTEQGAGYRITTQGVSWLQGVLSKKGGRA